MSSTAGRLCAPRSLATKQIVVFRGLVKGLGRKVRGGKRDVEVSRQPEQSRLSLLSPLSSQPRRGGPGFTSQILDTKTKRAEKATGRKAERRWRRTKEEGEKEEENDSGSRYRTTDCRRIFFCAVSASLKLNIDFACRAFQVGLRSNRSTVGEAFRTTRADKRADKRAEDTSRRLLRRFLPLKDEHETIERTNS